MSRQDYIQATNKAGFEKALKEGKISEEQIGFIEEEDLIWAKGNYYGAVPDNEDLTKDKDGKLQFSDRAYDPASFSGKGYKILRRNIVQERNVLTQEMMAEPNTIYEIRYDFDLNGATINVPEGCVLKFEGGSLKNGTLNGNDTSISCNYYDHIFKDITCLKTWNLEKASICWFGAVNSDPSTYNNIDISNYFSTALKSSFNTYYIPSGYYYVGNTINISKPITLLMDGIKVESIELTSRRIDHLNKTILYTDKNITVLEVAYTSDSSWSNQFNIVGGCIDTSSVLNKYSSSVINIKVKDGFKLWGGKLDTTIVGWSNKDLFSTDSKAICIEAYGDGSHCVDLKINSIIRGYKYGILIDKVTEGSTFINGITENSTILFCCIAFKSTFGDYYNLLGDYQSSNYFDSNNKNTPFVYIGGDNNYVNCKLWDLGQYSSESNLYTNFIGIETVGNNTVIEGRLLNILQVNNLIKGEFKDKRIWVPYNKSRNNYNYVPTDNFFILNKFFNYEVESSNCKVNNIDKVFKNSPINYSSISESNSSSVVKIKIKIIEGGLDGYGQLPVFQNIGIIISAYYKSYFSKLKIEVLNKSKVIAEEVFSIKERKDGNPLDINFNKISEYLEFSDIVFTFSDFKSDNSDYNSVQLYKIYGKTLSNIENYLTTSGGDFFGEFTRNGLLFIDNKKHNSLSSIPTNYAINSITEVNGDSVIYNNNKWDFISKDLGGSFNNKPSKNLRAGMSYYCEGETIKNSLQNSMIYYNGTAWVDSQGNPADALKKGTTAQRPTGIQPGFHYFDTDLGHDMVWDGQEWYDPTNKDEFSDLYKIMYNQHASVSVSSNVPGNIIEKGVSKAVTLSWNYIFNGASTTPDTLQLKSGQDILVGDKNTKTYTDNIQDTKTYQVVSVMKGVTKTAGITINAYYPIYYGGSSKTTLTSEDVLAFTKHGAIKSNPSGSYNFQVNAGEYAWICVPAGMVINKVTSNGFGVPIEPLATVAVTGKGNYNCYRSSETFTSGMFSCVVG